MAITDVTIPEEVSMCRQPVLVGLTSNLPTDGRPINQLRLTVSGNPNVDETISISYGEVSETFTVKEVADDSGNTISRQAALSLSLYARKIVEELNRNYALYVNFIIEYVSGSSDFVRFSPRTDRTGSYVVENNLTNISEDILLSVNTSFQPNPGLVVLVEKYNTAIEAYEAPIRHELAILTSQEQVFFDLQSDFDLRHHLPPSNTMGPAGNYFTPSTDNIQKYQIRYAERSGRPSTVAALTTVKSTLYALYATNSFFDQYRPFWSFWSVNGRFLTTYPGVRRVTHAQPEWLYWMGRNSSNVSVRVTAVQQSGTTSLYSRGTAATSVGGIWLIKTGFTQLNLPDIPDDPIIRYTVQLTTAGEVVSETITYSLIADCVEHERFFLFGNSLGGCDTIRATGKFISRMERTVQSGQRLVDSQVLNSGRGEDFTYNVRGRNAYEGSVGYRSAAYIAYLQELLMSPEAWIIDVQLQRYTPIIVEPGSYDIVKDGDDLFTLRFAYRHSWDEQGLGVSDDGQRIILPPGNPDDQENTGG